MSQMRCGGTDLPDYGDGVHLQVLRMGTLEDSSWIFIMPVFLRRERASRLSTAPSHLIITGAAVQRRRLPLAAINWPRLRGSILFGGRPACRMSELADDEKIPSSSNRRLAVPVMWTGLGLQFGTHSMGRSTVAEKHQLAHGDHSPCNAGAVGVIGREARSKGDDGRCRS